MAEKSMFGNCEFTPEEHAAIQTALKKKLGPSFISQRQCTNGRLAYIEGWRIINLANELFGFNGWSHSITRECTDFVDHHDGRFFVGVSAHVKITLKDGAYHEDIGYGSSEGMASKALALEKAKKEAVTDGLKRAFKSFGNSLGNCLTDRNYLAQIGRAHKPPPENLNMKELRHYTDEEEVQRARYAAMGLEKSNEMSFTENPITPGKQFSRPCEPALYRRKSLDGSFQPRSYAPNAGGTVRSVNGAGDGGHLRSNKHSGLSTAERERLERKQRQLQKQQEFRERMKKMSTETAPLRPLQLQNRNTPRDSTQRATLKRTGPLATSTQNRGIVGRPGSATSGDLTAADNFGWDMSSPLLCPNSNDDDTGMWDDSQLDHLMSENPNKVEAIIEQAQKPASCYQTPSQMAPQTSRPISANGTIPNGKMLKDEPMSPNSKGRITRSCAKSPFRKMTIPSGPGWKGRAPLRADENDIQNKRRKTQN